MGTVRAMVSVQKVYAHARTGFPVLHVNTNVVTSAVVREYVQLRKSKQYVSALIGTGVTIANTCALGSACAAAEGYVTAMERAPARTGGREIPATARAKQRATGTGYATWTGHAAVRTTEQGTVRYAFLTTMVKIVMCNAGPR